MTLELVDCLEVEFFAEQLDASARIMSGCDRFKTRNENYSIRTLKSRKFSPKDELCHCDRLSSAAGQVDLSVGGICMKRNQDRDDYRNIMLS